MATSVNDCTIGAVASEAAKKPCLGNLAFPRNGRAILRIFGKNTFWLWLDLAL